MDSLIYSSNTSQRTFSSVMTGDSPSTYCTIRPQQLLGAVIHYTRGLSVQSVDSACQQYKQKLLPHPHVVACGSVSAPDV